jgi:flagellar biosynthesis/type III secretory pathway protein FliH
MMNFSFSETAEPGFEVPFSPFPYRDMNAPAFTDADETKSAERKKAQESMQSRGNDSSAQEIKDAINRACAVAVAETEESLRKEYEARSAAEASKIRKALELFQDERKKYFSSVESDVIQLSLAIAAKILHREAQVDPLLVAALVRVAVEKLHDVSSVTVRVAPDKLEQWREYLLDSENGAAITVVDDAKLGFDDCVLETSLGSANFSIDAQLKEVEQGFFDLLAQRPVIK